MATIELNDAQKQAISRAAALVTAQATGLQLAGSKDTFKKVGTSGEALRRISETPGPVDLTIEDANHFNRARSILEGVRAGLENADFDERASKVDDDIESIGEVIRAYNTIEGGETS